MLKARDDAKLSERFGALIYRLREARKLSQRSAAQLIGISQTRLISLENGQDRNTGRPTVPSPELTIKIAQAYHYPKQHLLILAGYIPWGFNEDEAASASEWLEVAGAIKFDQAALERLKEFTQLSPERQKALLKESRRS